MVIPYDGAAAPKTACYSGRKAHTLNKHRCGGNRSAQSCPGMVGQRWNLLH
jgi:hypothetical protein